MPLPAPPRRARKAATRKRPDAVGSFSGKVARRACKPDFVHRLRGWMTIPLVRPLPAGSSCLPGSAGARRPCGVAPARDPYSALLPVGLAMRALLPAPRWALTPPFHPCRSEDRRSVLCGAFPGVAPAGRYPAPLPHGVRTFLDALSGTAVIQPSARGAVWRAGAPPSRVAVRGGHRRRQPRCRPAVARGFGAGSPRTVPQAEGGQPGRRIAVRVAEAIEAGTKRQVRVRPR